MGAPAFKVLPCQRRERRRCEECGRTVTPGKKHKYSRRYSSGWCKGYKTDLEKEVSETYPPAVRALAALCMAGDEASLRKLVAVSRQVLKIVRGK